MAPIYDTDVAESRWKQAEWRQFELWEKIELKARRRVRWIIAFTCVLFLAISAVPVVQQALPKWQTLRELRKVAQAFSALKTKSIQTKQPLRWVFLNINADQNIAEVRENKVSNCTELNQTEKDTSILQIRGVWVDQAMVNRFGFTGIAQSLCFDPIQGLFADGKSINEKVSASIALVSDRDVKTDVERNGQTLPSLSLLTLTGDSAEISFE